MKFLKQNIMTIVYMEIIRDIENAIYILICF